jgi:DNA helicase HerA-like ATPase
MRCADVIVAEHPYAFRQQVIAPVMNKLGALIASPIAREMFSNRTRSLNLRKLMDLGHVLLLIIPKGEIGEDIAQIIGAIVTAEIFSAAASRSDIPEAERRPFFLYLDEAHNYVTESLIDEYAEARKFHLGLFGANQYMDQFKHEGIKKAILANANTQIVFRARL